MNEQNTSDKVYETIIIAIQKDNFTSSEITSEFSITEIARAITRIVNEKRVEENSDKINLTNQELDNLYLLTKTIISKHILEHKEKNGVPSRRSSSRNTRTLLSRSDLNDMYRLQPA